MHGLVQRQRAGGFGGGHFAQAVPQHHVRMQTVLGERRGQCRLHGEQQRLHQFRQVQRRGQRGIMQGFDQRPFAEPGKACVHGKEAGTEGRVAVERGAPHANPLAAVARIDKAYPGRL